MSAEARFPARVRLTLLGSTAAAALASVIVGSGACAVGDASGGFQPGAFLPGGPPPGGSKGGGLGGSKGSGSSSGPVSRHPDFGKTVTLTHAPPPITGGTLLLTKSGAIAVAADPDRDQLYVVD